MVFNVSQWMATTKMEIMLLIPVTIPVPTAITVFHVLLALIILMPILIQILFPVFLVQRSQLIAVLANLRIPQHNV